jgi:hypothetical protein
VLIDLIGVAVAFDDDDEADAGGCLLGSIESNWL